MMESLNLRLDGDKNQRSEDLMDDYDGSNLVWMDEHFKRSSDRMTRSLVLLDDFCASVGDMEMDGQPMSLSAVESGRVSKRLNKHTKTNGTANETDSEEKDHAAILKTKFLSAFINVKNGWVVKSSANFSCGPPTWLLGNIYRFTKADLEQKSHVGNAASNYEKFKLDFRSRIWLTYRKDFPKLDGSQLTNDIGWGCMLRSGQMLLAQAFILHFLGREWVWKETDRNAVFHRQIIRYFGDRLHDLSPFSLQTLVGIGRKQGRNPGDWYGPASISAVLRDALEQANTALLPELDSLCIYIAMDGLLFVQDVIDLCTKPSVKAAPVETSLGDNRNSESAGADDQAHWRSVVILVPLRLGSDVLNGIYVPCLKTILCCDLCIGVIGGRPKHSMYFIGWQEEKLIHLDPHCSQDCVDVLQDNFCLESFHCSFPRKLSFSKMDPTCTLGFYCKTRKDFDRFLLEAPKLAVPPLQEDFPLFHFQPGSRADFESECRSVSNPYNAQSVHLPTPLGRGSLTFDDFTLL